MLVKSLNSNGLTGEFQRNQNEIKKGKHVVHRRTGKEQLYKLIISTCDTDV